jgi:hypothetical protein
MKADSQPHSEHQFFQIPSEQWISQNFDSRPAHMAVVESEEKAIVSDLKEMVIDRE